MRFYYCDQFLTVLWCIGFCPKKALSEITCKLTDRYHTLWNDAVFRSFKYGIHDRLGTSQCMQYGCMANLTPPLRPLWTFLCDAAHISYIIQSVAKMSSIPFRDASNPCNVMIVQMIDPCGIVIPSTENQFTNL